MIINVTVKANSKENKIEQGSNNIIAYVKASADRNKANIELVKTLAKHFSVSTADVKIIRGMTSKNKVIQINTAL